MIAPVEVEVEPTSDLAAFGPEDPGGLAKAFLELLARIEGPGEPSRSWVLLAQLVTLAAAVPAYAAVLRRLRRSGLVDPRETGRRRPSRAWYPEISTPLPRRAYEL